MGVEGLARGVLAALLGQLWHEGRQVGVRDLAAGLVRRGLRKAVNRPRGRVVKQDLQDVVGEARAHVREKLQPKGGTRGVRGVRGG